MATEDAAAQPRCEWVRPAAPVLFTLPGRHRRDLPASIRWERVRSDPSWNCNTVFLFHFGPGVVFTDKGARLVRQPVRGAKPMEYIDTSAGYSRLAPVRGGFVVGEPDRPLHGTAVSRSALRDVTPPGLRLDGDGDGDAIARVVGEPRSGRVALGIRDGSGAQDELLVLGPDFEIIDRIAVPVADCGGMRRVRRPLALR